MHFRGLMVHYHRITEMRYHYVNPNILQVQPSSTGLWQVEAGLLHFNRAVSSRHARALIRRQGLQPANLFELAAYGRAPDLQWPQSSRLVALGTIVEYPDACWSVGCVSEQPGTGRWLDLDWFEGTSWQPTTAFLVIRHRVLVLAGGGTPPVPELIPA